LVVALLSLISQIGFAQNPKREPLGYYNYVQPRMSTELDNAEFFEILVELADQDAYRRKQIEQYLSIQHFKAAGVDSEPDFTVKVIEAPFQFKADDRKSSVQKFKENGVERSRTVYFYTGSMTYHYTMKVLNLDGKELFRKLVSGSQKTKGRTSPSMTDAHDMYIQDKLKFKETVLKKSAEELATAFNNQFVNMNKTINLSAITIKEKKFDYPGFNKACADLIRSYAVLNINNEGTAESEELLSGCIIFWTEFVKDATPQDKKSFKNDKVTAAAYYNLGLTFFFLKNYSAATENFELTASYDSGVIAGIKNLINVSSDCANRVDQ